MRLMSKLAIAGAGSLALATGALAAERAIHTMTVSLPDGSVEHIRYAGDHPPQVALVPVDMPAVPMMDMDFAAFDQIFADMERQHAAMMQQMAAMASAPASNPGAMNEVALKNMPAGTVSYSYVSSTTGNGTCTQSYQATSYGANQPPKVVTQSSGDCSAMKSNLVQASGKPAAAPTATTSVKAAKPAPAPLDPNAI